MSIPLIDFTHEAGRRSWVESANVPGSAFPLQNLPFGRISTAADPAPQPATAIGDFALPLPGGILKRHDLVRKLESGSAWRTELIPLAECRFHLPFEIGDYTDFYASIHHATNVGRMFRPDNPLLPNYHWVPIGYHGRSSSIVVSGTPIRRPIGQLPPPPGGEPVFGPTRELDFELEAGFFVSRGNTLGEPIPMGSAEDHLFGVCLLNDWSARDIQRWEYQPLGPFLSKSFATSISPWVITMEALAPFRCPVERDHPVLPYLAQTGNGAIDCDLEVWLRPSGRSTPVRICATNMKHLYWSPAQLLTHQTSNGCNVRPGDLLGTGTISGPAPQSRACMLELTGRGASPLELPDGSTRIFLEDGDEVILSGQCNRSGFVSVHLGNCRGTPG